jgi:Uncharacterized protein conserved in bacteria (DUF2188)
VRWKIDCDRGSLSEFAIIASLVKVFSRTEFFIGGGVGQLPGQPRLDSPSPDPISTVAGERGPAQACSRAEGMGARGIMLGRHVYRVQPTEHGWTVIKEGENRTRADLSSREEALAEARRMARAEQAKSSSEMATGSSSKRSYSAKI